MDFPKDTADLIERYLEGVLDAPGRDKLAGNMRQNPELRKMLSAQIDLSILMAEAFQARDFVEDTIMEVLQNIKEQKSPQAQVAGAARPRKARPTLRLNRISRKKTPVLTWLVPLASAACVLMAILMWNQMQTTPVQAVPVVFAEIIRSKGVVEVIRDGKKISVEEGALIVAGDEVTTGVSSETTIKYKGEPSTVSLGASTKAKLWFEGGKRIKLTEGILSGDIAKQAEGEGMVLATPHAKAEVLGTIFTLSVEKDSSTLEVTEGKIRFTELVGEKRSVEVITGNYAVAKRGKSIEVLKTADISKVADVKKPRKEDNSFELGKYARNRGKFEEAVKHLRAAVEQQPDFFYAWYYLSHALYEVGDLNGSVETFTQALKEKQKSWPDSDFDDPNAFAHLFIFVAESRMGIPSTRLAKFREGWTTDAFPSQLADLFLGHITLEQCQAAVAEKYAGNVHIECSMNYFSGEYLYLREDKARARLFFEKAAKSRSRWLEVQTAQARLGQINEEGKQ